MLGVLLSFACILGMVPKVEYAADPKLGGSNSISNIVTPIILILLGVILPAVARRDNKKNPLKEPSFSNFKIRFDRISQRLVRSFSLLE